MYELYWTWKNKVRMWLRLSCVPRRCCGNVKNRGPLVNLEHGLAYRRCTVCASRHFEISVDPGIFSVRLE